LHPAQAQQGLNTPFSDHASSVWGSGVQQKVQIFHVRGYYSVKSGHIFVFAKNKTKQIESPLLF
jgi:hypothetical protein